jgi:hypothetical protein
MERNEVVGELLGVGLDVRADDRERQQPVSCLYR